MDMNERKMHIEYALKGLNMTDKYNLVKYAGDLYKAEKQIENKRAIGQFKRGDIVTFKHTKTGRTHGMIVESVGSKNIIGKEDTTGIRWRVPAYLCNKAIGE